ncbi:hypothetical protein KZX46_02575 (plasmid) [Polymorphobacter sp. PAMC 29334]|uniref:hypothetical protein n=1 Tax=Polymorphobacter sp. PAMC 29334 TaxID=2862331 RepID=UPI001C7757A6|nr:hypothetical protein [Polymorphobacter sp. PAMC 29334]QYE33034.1 hypothetical protein KZX46_02575 [Polymorphobacter sp. PAMC 29334]
MASIDSEIVSRSGEGLLLDIVFEIVGAGLTVSCFAGARRAGQRLRPLLAFHHRNRRDRYLDRKSSGRGCASTILRVVWGHRSYDRRQPAGQ